MLFFSVYSNFSNQILKLRHKYYEILYLLKLTVNGSWNRLYSEFFRDKDFNAPKRTNEREFGRMEKRIYQKSEKNNDEDGFGSTHFGSREEGI